MWDITAETKALALAPVRRIWCRAIFGSKSGNTWVNDRSYYETDKIVSAAVDIGTKSGGVQVGNAFCGKLTLRLLDGAEVHQNDRIIMRVGFYKANGTKSEEISLGWYYVDTIRKSNGIYTVVAYDKMLRAQKNYNSALTYPAKMSAVLGEICDSLGVNLAPDFAIPYDGTISEKPTKGVDSDGNTIYFTRRETLSYLASAMGGNFFFDAGGHLQLTRFEVVEDSFAAANSIEADISDDSYSVNGIVWTLGGVTYSRNDEDTDGIMEFENPLTFYPKEPVQHAIEERVTGLNYHEATIRRQGCGWFELGDIVTAYRADGTSAPVLITGLNYSIADGGFAEKIYSSARSSSQDNYTTGDIVGQSVPQSVGGAVCGNTTAESLDRKLRNGSHVTLVPTSSEILLFSYQGKCVAALRGTNSTTRPKNRDADGVELFTSDQNFSATIGAWGGGIRGEYSDSNTGNSARLLISDNSRFEVETITKSSREQYYGNISIKVGTITFRVAGASNSLYYDDGKNTLLFEDGALRINGKKVLTEE